VYRLKMNIIQLILTLYIIEPKGDSYIYACMVMHLFLYAHYTHTNAHVCIHTHKHTHTHKHMQPDLNTQSRGSEPELLSLYILLLIL
jgi:hypothetical protein